MAYSVISYILAVEQEKSFSRAAKQLGVSQPALSGAISRTEQSLGTLLFDRTSSPVRLTDAGKAYVDYCRRSRLLDDELHKVLADIEGLTAGCVTIGGSSCFTTGCLPKATACFLSEHPGIDIRIIDGSTPKMAALTAAGELDLFITPEDIGNSELEMVKLFDERVFVCCPPDFDTGGLSEYEVELSSVFDGSCRNREYPPVPLSAFSNERFILISEGQHIRTVAEKLFCAQGFRPSSVLTVSQMMTSYALTVSGVGVSFVTESAVRFGNYERNARLFCPDADISRRTLCASYRANGYLSKAAHEYLRVLCSINGTEMGA